MKYFTKLCFILGILVVMPVFASTYAEDAELILNRILHIDSEKYRSTNENGEYVYNSLREYKDWSKIYIKYSKYEQKNKTLSKKEAKLLLLVGFVAKTNMDAALSESFSSDLVPLYQANRDKILGIMSELKFLIPSTCYYLNNYFGFEGKNVNKKPLFVRKNKSAFIKAMGDKYSNVCLSYFK